MSCSRIISRMLVPCPGVCCDGEEKMGASFDLAGYPIIMCLESYLEFCCVWRMAKFMGSFAAISWLYVLD
jgi:hypothetical protein